LDLRAKDVLLESLSKFTGTVVFVSHDRYFIDKLATRVFEIGDGRIEVFPGNYEDYLWRKQGREGTAPSLEHVIGRRGQGPSPSPPADRAAIPGAGAGETEDALSPKRVNPIKLRQMKERCQEVEEEIMRLEAAIAQAETALENFVNAEDTRRQTELLRQSKADLETRMAEWEQLAGALEQ